MKHKNEWASGFTAGLLYATDQHDGLRSACHALIERIRNQTALIEAIDHQLHQLSEVPTTEEVSNGLISKPYNS